MISSPKSRGSFFTAKKKKQYLYQLVILALIYLLNIWNISVPLMKLYQWIIFRRREVQKVSPDKAEDV